MPGRGNGLDAESYKPLTDLEPGFADDMLAVLRTEGVAAYVTPLDEEPDLLRLWVDAAATSRARALLRERRAEAVPPKAAAEPAEAPADTAAESGAAGDGATATVKPAASPAAEPDEDEVWAQIVAGFDAEVSDPVPRWPVAEDVDGTTRTGKGRGTPGSGIIRPGDGSFRIGVTTPGPRDWTPDEGRPEDGEPDELDEDPEAHFVPPPPPPLPKTDLATKTAWLALLGGPLFLVGAVLLGRPIGEWTTFMAVAVCGGGFVALVSRLRRDHDEDDPDDGAVV
ncbi:LPXTG cell wall anchor domain-containing protein [Yinghuangia seranimata]|uniref:LPXTG cell wall anchor domain-containing protein n=1 Tax=Yinghuangia seranimata TaxID=408067 RepID=UPI00248B9AD3|nr:LPXTG cell wall anchor domain-containing protein [Yinghuangia seranimata]MDI2126126.1 LPXTG cell wall anchor domain-containing protein [Yinghuangia seranimata]